MDDRDMFSVARDILAHAIDHMDAPLTDDRMDDRVVLEAESGVARYPETDDDPDAEALEVGRRVMALGDTMAVGQIYYDGNTPRSQQPRWSVWWFSPDDHAFLCGGDTALEALRALDAQEEG